MDKRVIGTIAIAGVVGAAAAILLSPKGRQNAGLALQKVQPSFSELAPLVQAGAENVLHLAENHRAEFVDAVTLILTRQDGSPNVTDPAARQRAERLVDQGTSLLRSLVAQRNRDGQTIEGQVIEPAPAA